MSTNFRVRFAPAVTGGSEVHANEKTLHSTGGARSFKSRLGCQQCKCRHLKCDERFPICGRCEKRGVACSPAPRLVRWHVQMPWLLPSSKLNDMVAPDSGLNERLLRHWLEKTSQMMTIDLEENPMSYPVLPHLTYSSSLLHTVQSISAAHEHSFNPQHRIASLQERHLALMAMQTELSGGSIPPETLLLTIILLGWSAPWIDQDRSEFGKEHLHGARALVDKLLDGPGNVNAAVHFLVGAYIYWHMCCAFTADPGDLRPLDSPSIRDYIHNFKEVYHPITGYSLKIFFLLGNLGKYCRQILAGEAHDTMFELCLEHELLEWTPSDHANQEELRTGEAFRQHGLIMLYRICKPHVSGLTSTWVDDPTDLSCELDTEQFIRREAVGIIENLGHIPLGSNYLNLQSIPLLTAASELTAVDIEGRSEVIRRFKAMYSSNRCPHNLWAIDFIEELWSRRDQGESPASWLVFVLQKGWKWSMC